MTNPALPSVETLQIYVAALNRAIASGARSVTLGGQTIIYNTTDSLIRARDDMIKQLRQQGASRRASRQSYAVFAGRDY